MVNERYMTTILSLLMAVAYIAAVIIKDKKLPDSISALVYALPNKWQWIWTLWLWVVSLLMCIPLIDVLPETWKSLGFFTLVCLGFVGAMPIIYKEHKKAHDILGVLAGILSQVCVFIISPWWLLVWFFWPFLMGSTIVQPEGGDMRELFKGKGVFVAEVICMITLAGAITF